VGPCAWQKDQQLAFNKTGEIMKAYPNVKGIIGLSSVAFPGAADAVSRAGNPELVRAH
jgi:ABC-type sugar transport system substrate-binding protein